MTSDKLMRILKDRPGKNPVVLYVRQADGRRMRAAALTADSGNQRLKAHLYDLFGRTVGGLLINTVTTAMQYRRPGRAAGVILPVAFA